MTLRYRYRGLPSLADSLRAFIYSPRMLSAAYLASRKLYRHIRQGEVVRAHEKG